MTEQKRPLILVVDSNENVLGEVAALLEGAGYALCCCTDVAAAMVYAQAHAPNLIICDANLPGESGLVLCERVRRNDSLRHVPVMLLSPSQTPDIIRRGCAGDVTYSVRKPFAAEVLLELVTYALCPPPAEVLMEPISDLFQPQG